VLLPRAVRLATVLTVTVGIVATTVSLCPAADAAGGERDHVIVPEDYFTVAGIGSIAVGPNGRWIAYVESRWGEKPDDGRQRDLWCYDRREERPVRLTFAGFGAGQPAWSPAGDWIYFTGRSERAGAEAPPHDGQTQIWRVRPEGGEPQAVTRVDDGVGTFALAPDGDALYFTVSEEHHDDEWKDLKQEHGDLEYGHGVVTFDAVHRLDLVRWRTEEVLAPERVIRDLALSADGQFLALITTEDEELIFHEGWSRVDVVDLASGATTSLTDAAWRAYHPSPYGWIENLAWAHDGGALAFTISFDGHPTRIYVAERDGEAWPVREVMRADEAHYAGGLVWRGEERTLCYLGEDRGRVRILAVAEVEDGGQGRTRTLTRGDVVGQAFGFSPDGRTLVANLQTTTRADDLYHIEGADRFTRLTDANPQVDTWILPQIQDIDWTGGEGAACHGILELPAGHDPTRDGPLPLIVELHGGPTAATHYRLRLWIYGRALMPANGYALFSPNYRGSTGYGDAFLTQLIGRENDIEVADILTGVDHLVAAGIADPDRIGVTGWSNGGYLTNCVLVARPSLFKAASSGAGVLDMVIQWATEDTPGHVINFMGGLPWEVPDHYRTASPIYGLDGVTTPTLVHVGGNDPRVPPAHSRALYRALHHYLDVPCELVVYPGEPHGLTKRKNRLAKMEWDLAWFGKYLPVED
jgi:dipeptidyl aminopeptidase/acylaminoacyl peptidase